MSPAFLLPLEGTPLKHMLYLPFKEAPLHAGLQSPCLKIALSDAINGLAMGIFLINE